MSSLLLYVHSAFYLWVIYRMYFFYHGGQVKGHHLSLTPVCSVSQGTWVVSALRQLHRFAKGFFKTGYHKDQVRIQCLYFFIILCVSSCCPSAFN